MNRKSTLYPYKTFHCNDISILENPKTVIVIHTNTYLLLRMDPRFFGAVRSGDLTSLHALLTEDPLILDRISLNSVENPLHVSSFSGQTQITREMVCRKPAFARELNQDGFSLMHIASANGHVELLRVGYDICLLKGKDSKLHFIVPQ